MSDFVYYNLNPYGVEEEDCVCRAISLATNLDYEIIAEKLALTGELLDCDKLCVCCYKFLLEDVFKAKRVSCDNMSVGEFANFYHCGTFLVRINGHLTCVIDSCIYDIWDCRSEFVTDAWEVSQFI